jgi:hypothetical protein
LKNSAPVAAPIAREGDLVRYLPDGQVRAVALIGENRAALAVGNGGIHLVEYRPKFRVLSITPTKDIAYDIACRGNRLYVAESSAGVSAWDIGDDFRLTLKGRYAAEGISAQQVAVPEGYPYALIGNHGRYAYRFEILDISKPEAMRLVFAEPKMGMLYPGAIAPRLQGGRYAAVHWAGHGPLWFDLGGEKPVRITDRSTGRRQFINGVEIAADDRVFVVHGGGYNVVQMNDPRPLSEMILMRPDRGAVTPTGGIVVGEVSSMVGNLLLFASGPEKRVRVVDVLDASAPKLIETIATQGTPARVVGRDGYMLIPEGRGGLTVHQRIWAK